MSLDIHYLYSPVKDDGLAIYKIDDLCTVKYIPNYLLGSWKMDKCFKKMPEQSNLFAIESTR